MRREPRDAEAWHALGLVRVGLGKLEAARQAYASGLHADPQALENHLGLATVALLGAFLVVMFRREVRRSKEVAAAASPASLALPPEPTQS